GVLGQWQVAVANEREANEQAAKAQDERDNAQRQREQVRKANDQLRIAQAQLRRTLYHSQMQLGWSALQANDLPRARELLEQQRPKEGEADLRGFEWDYLRRACHADRLTFVAHPCASDGGGISILFSNARVCYSPDGKRLVTSWPNALRVHDAQTGKELL